MSASLNAYLQFRDDAREALEFYREVFGGKVEVTTFGEFEALEDAAEAGKVMHGELVTSTGLVIMASDTPAAMDLPPASSISLSLWGGPEDAEELRGYWDRLVAEGRVVEPLAAAPWGDTFGMAYDRFGTYWMVNIGAATS